MEKKVLITYATNVGSTADVAEAIGESLRQKGNQADVFGVREVEKVDTYNAVIVGGPMIMGWHKEALKFIERHQQSLSGVPVAYFFTALHLTRTITKNLEEVAVYIDSALGSVPKNENKLSFQEKNTTVESYLAPALKRAPSIKPLSVGFFAGKLDYSKLNIFQKIFVKLIIRGEAGDFRNWDAIREWSSKFKSLIHLNDPRSTLQ
jgi:menaquinone-dependent protoporphyrinogen oxidase